MTADLNGLLMLVGAIISSVLFLLLVVFMVELVRRRREDFAGFEEWVILGARHDFPQLLDAFAGHGAPLGGHLRTVSLGEINLPSGRLIVGDPAFFAETDFQAFDELLPPGRHKVDALVLEKGGDQRVCALRIVWIEAVPHHFQPAWPAESRFRCLEQRCLPGFGVDSALAALLSPEALALFKKAPLDDLSPGRPDRNPYLTSESGSEDLYRNLDLPGSAAETKDPESKLNMITVLSGEGDGSYHCYFACDGNGERLGFYVDFAMLGKPRRIPVT
ncbi:MAG TPA: DUF4241 domain-containing protein [Candidatus Obscuribacter sp.]|nr:DUF4241 domain-containing protein [Candidatus Obscuribacter sp.]MBK9279272.1 DUF4241 domain-containing protein [Candidatus Obscuribacter sp.]MBL8084487.1 DUF4241 domain-containing protein [Candidatus Obscuribacter sp.]HNB16977.1 DUF4241 domain-containing protein [Candidatus Obscuribacter sp.]HND07934.1 DUF4241 domain-containing protein [Candidatus Obscuribacter sp.]